MGSILFVTFSFPLLSLLFSQFIFFFFYLHLTSTLTHAFLPSPRLFLPFSPLLLFIFLHLISSTAPTFLPSPRLSRSFSPYFRLISTFTPAFPHLTFLYSLLSMSSVLTSTSPYLSSCLPSPHLSLFPFLSLPLPHLYLSSCLLPSPFLPNLHAVS